MKFDSHYHHEQGLVVEKKRRWPVLVGIFLLFTIGIVGLVYAFWPRTANAPEPPQENAVAEVAEPEPEEPAPQFNAKKLQQAVDNWANKQSGAVSVVITDKTGDILAEKNPNEVMFAASIYKLYVAYEGYRRVDNGTFDPDEKYLGEWTRAKCLDEMIRSSHSPCAEKMWVEIGKEELTNTLRSYTISNTSMTNITTTANDAAKMLVRIETDEGLSKESRKAYLNSMKNQKYRDALPKGFANQTVYDKVGFNQQIEYHDVGIVEFADGRRLIVAVQTKRVGTANIAALASAIAAAVN